MCVYVCVCVCVCAVVDLGFSTGGANSQSGCANLYFLSKTK